MREARREQRHQLALVRRVVEDQLLGRRGGRRCRLHPGGSMPLIIIIGAITGPRRRRRGGGGR
jgi:hypothetical protein